MAPARAPVLRDAAGRPCVPVAEAARRLGITREAVRQAVQAGRLEAVTVSQPVVAVPLAALRRYRVLTPAERAAKGGRAGRGVPRMARSQ